MTHDVKHDDNDDVNQAQHADVPIDPQMPILESVGEQDQVAELTAALQRERADATNLRRRHDEQIANVRTSVKTHVVRDLLPIIDNLERAQKFAPDTKTIEDKRTAEWITGIVKILDQFEKTLKSLDVERIKTVGEPFDPRYHEAVAAEDGDGEEIVSEELQSGYKIGDEVVRHAMVRVRS